jgi:hypothetical protein
LGATVVNGIESNIEEGHMNSIAPPPTTPKPRRRWLQFSLRTLLVVVLICSAPCGWFAYKVKQAREEWAAVESVQNLGGWIRTSPDPPRPVPAWLCGILGHGFASNIIDVHLGSSATVDWLQHLKKLPHLECLDLNGTAITDEGLAYLKDSPQVQKLDLGNSEITDAGLKHLSGFPLVP